MAGTPDQYCSHVNGGKVQQKVILHSVSNTKFVFFSDPVVSLPGTYATNTHAHVCQDVCVHCGICIMASYAPKQKKQEGNKHKIQIKNLITCLYLSL